MVPKHKSGNSRRKQSGASPLEAKITKIASLATHLTQGPSPGESRIADIRDEQLDNLLDSYLNAGRDDVLLAAIEAAYERGGREAGLEVQHRLECATAIDFIEGAEGEDMAVTLAVLPIAVCFMDGEPFAGGDIPLNDTFDRLVKSFKKHGLVRKDATVFAAPYLYDWEELSLPFTKVSKLRNALTRKALAGAAVSAEALAQTASRATVEQDSDDAPSAEIRILYLVMGHCDAPEFVPFAASFGETDAQRRKLARQRDTWEKDAVALIAELLGASENAVKIGQMDTFYEGVRQGVEMGRLLSLYTASGNQFDANAVKPQDVQAIVNAHGEDDCVLEYRVSYMDTRTDEFIGGVVFEVLPWDESQKAVELELHSALKGMGIGDIVPPDDLCAMEKCPCCDGPAFFVPTSEDGVDEKPAVVPEGHGHTLH